MLEIASRLFWRPEKASPFRFEKSPFQLKKAVSFRFGKIAFSGRHVGRNCEKVVAPRQSVPFQVRKNRLFSWKSDFYQVWKNRFFRLPRRSKLRQGCSVALKTLLFQTRKNRFELKKAISFRFGKCAFSGRQDARNSVKVVLAPSKSVPFHVRKNRLFSWKSDFFQVRKNRFFRSPRCWKLFQSCSGSLKKSPFRFGKIAFLPASDFFQVRKNRFFQVAKTLEIASRLFWRPHKVSPFSWYNNFLQVRKIRYFRSPRHSKLRQGCSGALKKRNISDSEKSPFG